jgi:hypothetical protein
VVSHIHRPSERILDGVRVVAVGSVGKPNAPDLRASYVLLAVEAPPGGVSGAWARPVLAD